jgi:DNA-binding NarL/FixJ family response regulator
MLNTAPAVHTRILLVDDHPIIRFGFIALLTRADSSLVFHEAENGYQALEAAKAHAPRLALVDLSLAGSLSLDLIKRLRQARPDMAILVVSMHDEKLYAERVLRAGARGYVMKQTAAKTIANAVECVLNGKIWLSDALRDDLVNRIGPTGAASRAGSFNALSDREATVFALIGKGLKKGDIAKELNLSPNTIETYRTNIKQKLGLATGAELYRTAFLQSQDDSGKPFDK